MNVVWKKIIRAFAFLILFSHHDGAAAELGPGFIIANNIGDINGVGNAPIYYWTGPGTQALAPVQGTYVQILGRPTGSRADFELIHSIDREITFKLLEPGYFGTGRLVIPSVVGPIGSRLPVDFIIRAWRGANSWELAQTTPGALLGQTPVFQDDAIADYIGPIDVPLAGYMLHATRLR